MVLSVKKGKIIKELQALRNIGPKMAEKLYNLGIQTSEQMKASNPDKLFKRLKGIYSKVDPCELYVFKGAILDIPWWMCKDIVIQRGDKGLWRK
ncbi:MAG: helix-hairpin-helix domain-containing protein [Candidatus Omnitrophota bacterium]